MHPGIRILEEVVRLARDEFRLMELEDADGLSQSAEKRGALLTEAWEQKGGCNEADFSSLLVTLQDLQAQLTSLAEKKFAETRDALNAQKKNQKAVIGYCKVGAGYGRGSARMFTKLS